MGGTERGHNNTLSCGSENNTKWCTKQHEQS